MDHNLKMDAPEPQFQIHTFGCKVNTYDSGLIERNIQKSNVDSTPSRIHILNTCAVTAEATKEAVRTIRRLKSKDPLCTVVVTGCAAQVDTGSFENLPGADLVVANSHKMKIPEILQDYFKGKIKQKVFKSNIFHKEDLESGGGLETSHSRSFLKIQDGCNSFCTFCVIPYARGKSRSLSISALIDRVNHLHQKGFQEIVLTGVHIGDYEDSVDGNKKQLEDLVEAVLLKTKVPRFRLTSLEPIELTNRLLELYSDPRLCPHFHMSIQSANSDVLKNMKRKYTQSEVEAAFYKIEKKLPNAFVGLDVIAGFPTETHEQFEDTYESLARTPWTRLHVFPYSERPGTKAAQFLNAVPWPERLHRASRLRELSSYRLCEKAKMQVGTTKNIILLKNTKNKTRGLSRDFWNVEVENSIGFDKLTESEKSNQEFKVKVLKVNLNTELSKEIFLQGELLSENGMSR
ncbi:MAG: tRNA (N(6)-L-threonylcarbamoyladenosine(37)-C(2))-methylthiotransferase MtaB [Bdellovibrionota bacterium]